MKGEIILQGIAAQLNIIESKIDTLIQLQKNSLQKFPEKADAPNPLGHKRCFSHKLIGGFRDPEVRALIIKLRKQGQSFTDIADAIKNKYPDNPEKQVHRSAIHRFCEAARKGRLLQYGIDAMLNLKKMEG